MSVAPPKALLVHIQELLGADIVKLNPVSGGCISPALLVTLSNKKSVFMKWNIDAPEGFFEAESNGLKMLKDVNVIKIPEVISCNSKTVVPAYILLEALEVGSKTKSGEASLGKALAKLHKSSAENFGLDADNFIGRLQQKNTWNSSWSEFFFENRLVFQAELGIESGWFNWEFQKLLSESEQYIKKTLSKHEEKPSLIHGDLWSGNVFWSSEGPALIDPAVYYASREADIAFSEMFGGFGRSFYSAYKEEYPLSEGYEERKQILNLYHLMTHSNLFGGSYIASVKRVLKKFSSLS